MSKNLKIDVWSQTNCAGCTQVKNFLKSKGYAYTEYILGVNAEKETLFTKAPGIRSVPQVFIDDKLIGGVSETMEYVNNL